MASFLMRTCIEVNIGFVEFGGHGNKVVKLISSCDFFTLEENVGT